MAWFTNPFFCANVTHFWFSYHSLNSTNQARVTFTRGPKSDISHVLQHDFSLNGRVAFHAMFTSLTCARRHNITSLFRLWLHINLKLAKHVQHRLLRMWRVTSGPCTGHTWDGHVYIIIYHIWAVRPAVWTTSSAPFISNESKSPLSDKLALNIRGRRYGFISGRYMMLIFFFFSSHKIEVKWYITLFKLNIYSFKLLNFQIIQIISDFHFDRLPWIPLHFCVCKYIYIYIYISILLRPPPPPKKSLVHLVFFPMSLISGLVLSGDLVWFWTPPPHVCISRGAFAKVNRSLWFHSNWLSPVLWSGYKLI